jgi:hypothetical protein
VRTGEPVLIDRPLATDVSSESPDDRPVATLVGSAGIAVMLLAHLVWDPALTLLGVAEFGIQEEDSAFVRSLLTIHPLLWLGLKLGVVGGLAAFMYREGVHRTPQLVWLPWLLAVPGIVGPLGWLELLVAVA